MLTKIFSSAPLKYYKRGEYWVNFFNADYHANVEPYIETLNSLQAIFVHNIPTPVSPNSIYVLARYSTSYWPSWAVSFHRFDSVSGAYLGRISVLSNIGTVALSKAFRGRSGKLYWGTIWGRDFLQFALGNLAGTSTGDVPEGSDNITWSTGPAINDAHFGLSGFAYQFGGDNAFDEVQDLFFNGVGGGLNVYKLSTGEYQYTASFPVAINQLALEDASRIYILFTNDVLILYDYVLRRVMGSTKIPPEVHGGLLAWDTLFRRLLFIVGKGNNPDGSAKTNVDGYRLVPSPSRLTTPIPLKVPKSGRIIPVMTQVVGELNEGVGGYVVTSKVLGSGTLIGIPTTDIQGIAYTQVKCDQNLAGSPDGLTVEVDCSITVPDGPATTGQGTTDPNNTPNPPPDVPPPDDGIPNYLGIVQAAHTAGSIGPGSSGSAMWEFVRNTVANINASNLNPAGITCGFTIAPVGGSNTFVCGGTTFRYNRVTFSNGHTFKIVEDSDPGGTRIASWDDEGIVDGVYGVATAPGSAC